VPPARAATPGGRTEAVLASWHELLDAGRMQDNTPFLAATAKPVRAHLSPATASAAGIADGEPMTVSTEHGSITLPAHVTEMVDGVVWVPTRSTGSEIHRTLGVAPGAAVRIGGVA